MGSDSYFGSFIYEYIKRLDTFPFLVSCSNFAGTPMDAPLDGCIAKLLTTDTREGNNYREHV
jgi:hypothetical protein